MKRPDISNNENSLNLQVPFISFIDDNTHIIYCPVLDLSGYGNDETEARKSFDTVLQEYISYTLKKNSLWSDLKNLGWTITKSKKKFTATPPPISIILESNEEFQRIFNNYPFKKYNTGITLPAA